jgi:hypothetical protein
MVLCEMPEEKHDAMKTYYGEKSLEQNDALSGELDSLGRRSGQTIYQDRKSSSSRGRVSAMED